MANETTTSTMDDPIFTSWIDAEIQQEARPYRVSKPLFDLKTRRSTKRYDWPTQTDPGESSDLTEGTAMSNTALATGVASATAAMDGQAATVTDLLNAVIVGGDAISHVSQVLARSVYETEENELAANYANFSTTVGTTALDLTSAQFNAGVSALEQADADGPLVAVLHPVQTGDLRASLTATANANFHSNPQLNQSILDDLSRPAGYVGVHFGVPIYHTSAVPLSGTPDRTGAIFVKGMALGCYEIWDTRVETHRDALQPGTIVAATSCRGSAEILDRRGVTVKTDA